MESETDIQRQAQKSCSTRFLSDAVASFATQTENALRRNDEYQQLVEEVGSWVEAAERNPTDPTLLNHALVCSEFRLHELNVVAIDVLSRLELPESTARLGALALARDTELAAITGLLYNDHPSSIQELIGLIPKVGVSRNRIYSELARRGCREVIPAIAEIIPEVYSTEAAKSDFLAVEFEYTAVLSALRVLDAREVAPILRAQFPKKPIGIDPAFIETAVLLADWGYDDIPKGWLIGDFAAGRRFIESETGDENQIFTEMRSLIKKDWERNKNKYWENSESDRFELSLIELISTYPMRPSVWFENACRDPYVIRRTSRLIADKFSKKKIPSVLPIPELCQEVLSLDLLGNSGPRFSCMHGLDGLGLGIHQMPGQLADRFIRTYLRVVDRVVYQNRTRLHERLNYRPSLHSTTNDSKIAEFELDDLIENGIPTLSQLQRTIIMLLVDGYGANEIGAFLNLDERTIRRHREKIRNEINSGKWFE